MKIMQLTLSPGRWTIIRWLIAFVVLVAVVLLFNPTSTVHAANLTPNPDFESVCSGVPCNWTATWSATIASSPIAHSGNRSMSVTRDISAAGAQSDCFPISAGDYDLSFWYKTSSANIVFLQGGINTFAKLNCAGNGVETAIFPNPLRTDGKWSNVKQVITPPTGTKSVQVEFLFHCGGTFNVDPCSPAITAHFDDVCFAPAGTCPPPYRTYLPLIMR
jgi:hypothetical protein